MENELSPETIEMVMKKVVDIQAYGTAFQVLNANRGNKKEVLADILRNRILGLTKARKDEERRAHYEGRNPSHTQRDAYVEDIKSGELPQVWFDMLGRSRFTDNMKKSYWMNSFRYNQAPINIALVFDISKFTDGIGGSEDYLEELQKLKEGGSENPADDYIKNHSKIGTYFPANTEGPKDPAETDWWNDENQTQSNPDEGHVLFGRISPRYFKGIVLKVNNLETSQKTHSLEEEHDQEII